MGIGIITKLRIVSAITGTWGKIEKQLESERKLGMKLSVNSIVQTLMLALQGLNQISDILPLKGKFWVMIGISAIQGIIGVMAHFVNPDGTSAKVAYVKGAN